MWKSISKINVSILGGKIPHPIMLPYKFTTENARFVLEVGFSSVTKAMDLLYPIQRISRKMSRTHAHVNPRSAEPAHQFPVLTSHS